MHYINTVYTCTCMRRLYLYIYVHEDTSIFVNNVQCTQTKQLTLQKNKNVKAYSYRQLFSYY